MVHSSSKDNNFLRWGKSQVYETKYWNCELNKIEKYGGDLAWYAAMANQVKDFIGFEAIFQHQREINILEIGSGPVGLFNYLPGKGVGIDPLISFYNQHQLVKTANVDYKPYLSGMGESLPFRDRSFHLVLCVNTLDHCMNPSKVINEIHRVLMPRGYLYLMVNVRTSFGCAIRNAMEIVQIDKAHPHSFTSETVNTMLNRFFVFKKQDMENFIQKRKRISKKIIWREYLKLFIGINGYRYTLFCQKK